MTVRPIAKLLLDTLNDTLKSTLGTHVLHNVSLRHEGQVSFLLGCISDTAEQVNGLLSAVAETARVLAAMSELVLRQAEAISELQAEVAKLKGKPRGLMN